MARPVVAKFAVSLWLALAASAVTPAGGVTPQALARAAALSARAFAHLAADALQDASAEFEEALHAVPGYPDAELGLGHVAMRRASFESALHHYLAARDALLAAALRAHDEIARRAVLAPRRGIAEPDPLDGFRVPAKVSFALGSAYFRLGRDLEAAEAWELCARTDPKFAIVFNDLAVLYYRMGRLREAEANLVRAEDLGVHVDPRFKNDLARAMNAPREAALHDPS